MGTEYTILVWKYTGIERNDGYDGWGNAQVWSGESLQDAMNQMQVLKEQGNKCITLVWRPK